MGRKPIWPPRPHVHQRDNVECICIQGIHYPLGKPGSQDAKQEYARIVAEFTKAGSSEHLNRKREPIVAEVLAAWLERPRTHVDRSTKLRESQVAAEVAEAYGNVPVSAFGPLALGVCRDRLVRESRSRRYLNRMTNMIRSAWQYAVSIELVTVEQWMALKTLPPLKLGETTAHETKPVMPCDPKDVETVLPHLPATVAAICRMQMLTGARPSEICRMRAGEVHRDGKIQLSRGNVLDLSTYGIWVYTPNSHKTARLGKERHILLGPQAQIVLTPWLENKQDQDPVFSPRNEFPRIRAGAKFRPGEFYSASSLGHAVRSACRRLGVPVWTPYQLRHLMATEVREEADLESAQAVLGHDDPKTTLIYALRSFRKAAEIIGRLG